MTHVFSGDLECIEELLKIILKRNDLSVKKSITQLTIGNLFGRSVRLDIYANDAAGNMILKSSRMIAELFLNEPLTVHYLIQGLSHQNKNIKKCRRHILSLLYLMMF